MGDSSRSSRSSISYEESWNSNEPYDSDVWNEETSPEPQTSELDDDSEGTITETEDGISYGTPVASQLLEAAAAESTEAAAAAVAAAAAEVAAEAAAEAAAATAEAVADAVADAIAESLGVPFGNYLLVGWNLHMTGNRLIDEICQISAYTAKDTFNIFVMPYGNPNNYIREHYGLQIANSGPYRILRDVSTRRVLRSRPDVVALTDFIYWLEKIKGDKDGIVLIYHDIKKLVPLKLIQCLKQFDLLKDFKQVVKGFCNICTLAEGKNGQTKYFSLKVLSNVLLPHRNIDRRGTCKARTCHDVLVELLQNPPANIRVGNQRMNEVELIRQVCESIIQQLENHYSDMKNPQASYLIHKYSVTVDTEEFQLTCFEDLLERQNSFRPVFKDIMNYDASTRQTLNRVRRKIVNQDFCLKDVELYWKNNSVAGLVEFFSQIENITDREFDLSVDVFERFFNPELQLYLDFLKNKKTPAINKQEVKEAMAKSFAKLPKAPEQQGEAKNHRRNKSL